MDTSVSTGVVEVHVRSTPTPFKGRQSAFGFIPDDQFIPLRLNAAQLAELQKNPDLYTAAGNGPTAAEDALKLAKEASAALAVEVQKHNETKAALVEARSALAAVDHAAKRDAYMSDIALASALQATELTLLRSKVAAAEAAQEKGKK